MVNILFALERAGHSIKQFTIMPTSNAALGRASPSLFCLPGMSLNFDRFLRYRYNLFSVPLVHLTKLHIDLADEDFWKESRSLQDSVGKGGLAHFLKGLCKLDDIYIRLHTIKKTRGRHRVMPTPLERVFGEGVFRYLRWLKLDSLWLDPSELCRFLVRHQSTLEELTLSNINLSGVSVTPGITAGATPLPQLVPNSDHIAESPPSQEWYQVAQTCCELPKLLGLNIEAPSTGPLWEVLDLFVTEELLELAMNGRKNKMAQGKIEDMWESLETAWGMNEIGDSAGTQLIRRTG